jgi:hypothetical protein
LSLRLLGLLNVLLCPIALGQAEQNRALVNLGMLESTRISASSVNGNREVDNQYYGALNLFDGGENRINNINYTTWLTDSEPRHWVKLQFEAPVEVNSVMLELPGKEVVAIANPIPAAISPTYSCVTSTVMRPRATELAIDLTEKKNGAIFIRKVPSVEITGFRLYYPLRKTVRNVTELTVVFPGPSILEVSELEVMGFPTKSSPLRATRPIPSSSK